MALGTDHFVAADLAASIPEIWGNRVNDFFKRKMVAGNFFVDRSDEVRDGGDILHTPVLSAFTVNAKAAQTEVVLSDPAQTSVDLTIATHNHVAFLIEDKEAAQLARQYRTMDMAMRNAAYAVANDLDAAIMALFAGFSTVRGTTATILDDDDVRGAISDLESVDAPDEDAAFILHPKTIWDDLMQLDRFALVQNTGDPSVGPLTGELGRLYGYPVLKSTNVPTSGGDYQGFFGIPDAIHWASANLPGTTDSNRVRLQAEYKLQWLGTLVVADILYGVIENRDNAGVQLLSVQ